MAPKQAASGSRGSSNSSSSGGGPHAFDEILGKVKLEPYWANMALLVVTAIAVAAMLPSLIMMLKIKTNLNPKGFKSLKGSLPTITMYVSPHITQNIDEQLTCHVYRSFAILLAD